MCSLAAICLNASLAGMATTAVFGQQASRDSYQQRFGQPSQPSQPSQPANANFPEQNSSVSNRRTIQEIERERLRDFVQEFKLRNPEISPPVTEPASAFAPRTRLPTYHIPPDSDQTRQVSSPSFQQQSDDPFRLPQMPGLLAPGNSSSTQNTNYRSEWERFPLLNARREFNQQDSNSKNNLQLPGSGRIENGGLLEPDEIRRVYPHEIRPLAQPTYQPYSRPRIPLTPSTSDQPGNPHHPTLSIPYDGHGYLMQDHFGGSGDGRSASEYWGLPGMVEQLPRNGYPKFRHHYHNSVPPEVSYQPQTSHAFGKMSPELESSRKVDNRRLLNRLPTLESFGSSRPQQLYQGISRFDPFQSTDQVTSCHFDCEPAIYYIRSFAGSSRVGGLQSADSRIQTARGESFGVALGKIQGRNLRTEWEYFYRNNGISDWTDGASVESIIGRLRAQGGMFNARWEFTNLPTTSFQPYLGAGLGLARFDARINNFAGVDLFDNRALDTQFAWQFMAGVNWKLRPRLDLFVEYRLFRTNSFELTVPVSTAGQRFNYQANHLFGGASWKF